MATELICLVLAGLLDAAIPRGQRTAVDADWVHEVLIDRDTHGYRSESALCEIAIGYVRANDHDTAWRMIAAIEVIDAAHHRDGRISSAYSQRGDKLRAGRAFEMALAMAGDDKIRVLTDAWQEIAIAKAELGDIEGSIEIVRTRRLKRSRCIGPDRITSQARLIPSEVLTFTEHVFRAVQFWVAT